jgi:hypothetical protein
LIKNTLSIEEQDNVARYVADFEKTRRRKSKTSSLELVEKEAAKDYADKQKYSAKDADARKK